MASPATCMQKAVIIPQSSREFLPAWNEPAAWPKCLPVTEGMCSSSFSVAGAGGAVGVVKGVRGLCLSRMGAEGTDQYGYSDSLPVSGFFSLSLTFKFTQYEHVSLFNVLLVCLLSFLMHSYNFHWDWSFSAIT